MLTNFVNSFIFNCFGNTEINFLLALLLGDIVDEAEEEDGDKKDAAEEEEEEEEEVKRERLEDGNGDGDRLVFLVLFCSGNNCILLTVLVAILLNCAND